MGNYAQVVVKAQTAAKTLIADHKKAKDLMKEAEQNGKEALEKAAEVAQRALEVNMGIKVDAPLRGEAKLIDAITGNEKVEDAYLSQKRATVKDFERAGAQLAMVLKAAGQPENIGRIAMMYLATATMGPFGAAMMNVMYDKMVLGKSMSEEAMLKSFAIGMAAGYAAEAAQGWAEAKNAVDTYKHASYLSKVASSMAKNLTSDLGNAALNNKGLHSKDFLKSVLGAVASIESGNGIGAQIFESTLESGLKSITDQAVDNGMDLSEINMEEVEQALYNGFANGAVTEAVHTALDKTVVPYLPKRIDKNIIGDVKEMMGELVVAQYEAEMRARQEAMIENWSNMSNEERDILIEEVREATDELRDEAAQKLYGKRYDDLSSLEKLSGAFRDAFAQEAAEHLYDSLTNNPKLAFMNPALINGVGTGLAMEESAAGLANPSLLPLLGVSSLIVIGYVTYTTIDKYDLEPGDLRALWDDKEALKRWYESKKPGATEENVRDFDLYMEQHHGWKIEPKDRQDPKSPNIGELGGEETVDNAEIDANKPTGTPELPPIPPELDNDEELNDSYQRARTGNEADVQRYERLLQDKKNNMTDSPETDNSVGALPKKLIPLHPDSSLSKATLDSIRKMDTDDIVKSLKRDGLQPMRVKPDGRVMNGNHRLKVLKERGFDTDTLIPDADILRE